ncbi:MAG: ABC transporter substrate-binding protein [Beijerinckiaceae bacterium]
MRMRAAAALLLAISATASAQPPKRVASINLCTDQLLLAMGDPSQIAGLSPYARDLSRSFLARQAASFQILSGFAEDVLALGPDLVVSSAFSRRATNDMLRARGVRVEEFGVVVSIEAAKRDIARFGELIGHRDKADRRIEAIDSALARARSAAKASGASALAIQRRGWVSGEKSLTSSLLDAVGLRNAAEAGLGEGALMSLEAIVALQPDFLIVTRDDRFAEDQGRALLLHPAIAKRYPRERIIVLPEALTVCGGPELADALDRLAAQVATMR